MCVCGCCRRRACRYIWLCLDALAVICIIFAIARAPGTHTNAITHTNTHKHSARRDRTHARHTLTNTHTHTCWCCSAVGVADVAHAAVLHAHTSVHELAHECMHTTNHTRVCKHEKSKCILGNWDDANSGYARRAFVPTTWTSILLYMYTQ